MQRFRKILFSPLAAHDNPAAIRRVAALAAANGASLTVFGVVPMPNRLQRLLHAPGSLDDVVAARRTDMERSLGRLAAICSGIGADVGPDFAVGCGDPTVAIIEQVIAHRYDLVVVSSGADGEQTVIRRLLRKCPCPVWVIRPTRARTHRVMAAVNPDPEEAELNRLILDLAWSRWRTEGGELHVVSAWELFGESTLRNSPYVRIPATELRALLDVARTRHEVALRELLASSAGGTEPWQVHLVKGPASEVVPDVAARCRINMLVIGTVGRVGASAMVMGNTAERVLDAVSCSVIAVKPPSFVSPIAVGRS